MARCLLSKVSKQCNAIRYIPVAKTRQKGENRAEAEKNRQKVQILVFQFFFLRGNQSNLREQNNSAGVKISELERRKETETMKWRPDRKIFLHVCLRTCSGIKGKWKICTYIIMNFLIGNETCRVSNEWIRKFQDSEDRIMYKITTILILIVILSVVWWPKWQRISLVLLILSLSLSLCLCGISHTVWNKNQTIWVWKLRYETVKHLIGKIFPFPLTTMRMGAGAELSLIFSSLHF